MIVQRRKRKEEVRKKERIHTILLLTFGEIWTMRPAHNHSFLAGSNKGFTDGSLKTCFHGISVLERIRAFL